MVTENQTNQNQTKTDERAIQLANELEHITRLAKDIPPGSEVWRNSEKTYFGTTVAGEGVYAGVGSFYVVDVKSVDGVDDYDKDIWLAGPARLKKLPDKKDAKKITFGGDYYD